MLYCLEITKAYPDYKRPYASVSTYHFLTKEDANEKRRQEKRNYYEGFLQFLRDFDSPVPKDIDNIDEDVAQTDYIYSDTYMDMEPFCANLYEITIEDDLITSKRINFPPSNIIEGYEVVEDENEVEENEDEIPEENENEVLE